MRPPIRLRRRHNIRLNLSLSRNPLRLRLPITRQFSLRPHLKLRPQDQSSRPGVTSPMAFRCRISPALSPVRTHPIRAMWMCAVFRPAPRCATHTLTKSSSFPNEPIFAPLSAVYGRRAPLVRPSFFPAVTDGRDREAGHLLPTWDSSPRLTSGPAIRRLFIHGKLTDQTRAPDRS